MGLRVRGELGQAGWREAGSKIALGCSVIAFAWAILAIAFNRTPYVNYADGGILEIGIRHALALHRTTGPYSRFGWDQPGPVYFYLQAAPYFFWRNARTLRIATLLINAGAAAGGVALVGRRLGKSAGLAAAAIVTVLVLQVGIPQIANEWNPNVLVFPTLLFVYAVALSRGSMGTTLLAAGTGAFIAQTHVTTAPFVVVGTLISLGLNVFRTSGQDAVRLVGPSVLLLAALWAAPVAEEFTSSPGNLTKIIDFAKSTSSAHGWTEVGERAAQTLWRPNYLHNSPADFTGALVGIGAFGIIGLGAIGFGVKQRVTPSVLLSVICLVGFGTELISARRTVGPLYPYIWEWSAALPAGALLALLLPFVERTERVAQGIAAVASALIAFLSTTTRWLPMNHVGVLDEVSLIREKLSPGQVVDLDFATESDCWALAASMADELERHGVPVRVPIRYASMYDLPPIVKAKEEERRALRVRIGPVSDAQAIASTWRVYPRGDHYLALANEERDR